MKKMRKTILPLLMLSFVAIQCTKDDAITCPAPQDEEELITTMNLVFTDSAGILPSQTFSFKDVDGPGGNPPAAFDSIILNPNQTYNVSIELLNESVSPVEDITGEVLSEADEHIFCFTSSLPTNCQIIRTDSDGQYEIGLSSKWTTVASSSGTVTVILKHQPGVKDGTCAPGETDIEVVFPLKIQ